MVETGRQATPTVHWADRTANEVLEDGRSPILSTGISPSGDIHVGNMREVLTADAVFRALQGRRDDVKFNYVADNFDPLRKVYPFLDAAVYEPLVGRPLSDIPCPCGDHASYSDHFLEPFLAALKELRVEVEVERADQMYRSGRMNPCIVAALERRDDIAQILHEMTGKQIPDTWSPFNVLCPDCKRLTDAEVTGFSSADEQVHYRCGCGSDGSVPMAGGGKLVWRIDWPARWKMLGVTVEPFGKDHATRGGSYDTGVRIVREIFGAEPPHPIAYEWVRLKGRGDMSSSKGNVLSIGDVLRVVPPEVLRYLVIRENPQKTINFDPGLPLLQLVDSVDDASSKNRDERALELSRAGGFAPVGVPYKHLVVVAQAAAFETDQVIDVLHRTGYPEAEREAVSSRLEYVRRWLDSFAPEDLKFTVQSEMPPEAGELEEEQRRFLGELGQGLREGMDGQQVHELIYDLSQAYKPTPPGKLFQAIYVVLLGKQRGPRAGFFISLLGVGFCAKRFNEAGGNA